jgi:adenylate cyclase
LVIQDEKEANRLTLRRSLIAAAGAVVYVPEHLSRNASVIVIRRASRFPPALAGLAFALHFSGSFAWADDPAAAFTRSREVARRAVALDDKDSTAQSIAAVGELFSGRHDDAIRRLRRAIELDPNSNYVHGQLSAAYAFGGEAEAAIQQAQMAIRLSPRDFLNVIWHMTTAWAHLSAERFQEAADSAQLAIDSNPAFADAHGVLAAASAYLGRMADARASLDEFTSLIRGSLADQLSARPFRRPADRERYLLGLNKAGLPEL